MIQIEELKGKIITKIEKIGSEELIFHLSTGESYKMYHAQDCCESVTIEDICGDLDDLINSPLLIAEEVSNYEPKSKADIAMTERANEWGSCEWTFYKFATHKGYVDIRWFGESNGYYSTSVYFKKIE